MTREGRGGAVHSHCGDPRDGGGVFRPLTDGEKFERFRVPVNASGKPEQYPMFRITSPGRLIPEGISVEDLYLPIEER